MARHSDTKREEHAEYALQHSLTRSHREEVSELKEKIAQLEAELKIYKTK
jgi:phage shock protein A